MPGVGGAAVTAAEPSDPSGARVYGLLVLGVLFAVGVGVASRSSARAAA